METEFDLKWGVGARTAAIIVQMGGRFSSVVQLQREGMKVNAKSMMEVMLLLIDVKPGARIRMTITGSDEVAAMEELKGLFTYGPCVDRCPQDGCDGTPILLEYSKISGTTYLCKPNYRWGIAGWPDKPERVASDGSRVPCP